MQILRFTLILIGILGVFDTLIISMRSSLNLGVLLPALIGVPALFIGIFLFRLLPFFSSGFGLFVKWAIIAFSAALFLAFFITSLLISSKGHDDIEHVDVVIVLGAALRGETPTLVLSKRLDTAAALLREHKNAVVVVSGGKGDGEHISEAEAMHRYLVRKGIEKNRIIKEAESKSTEENFAFSYRLIKERLGAHADIAFVTTDFHVLRAGLVAKKQGIPALGVAAPDVWYISFNNHMRECVALWAYALFGKI